MMKAGETVSSNVDSEVHSSANKISVCNYTSESSKTYSIDSEDHTLGNVLRCALMGDDRTTLCGYTVPHPSERVLNLRLQCNTANADEVINVPCFFMVHHIQN